MQEIHETSDFATKSCRHSPLLGVSFLARDSPHRHLRVNELLGPMEASSSSIGLKFVSVTALVQAESRQY